MLASILTLLAQAEGHAAEENDPADLYPHWNELLVGAIAFAILFFFMWKWVLPRVSASYSRSGTTAPSGCRWRRSRRWSRRRSRSRCPSHDTR